MRSRGTEVNASNFCLIAAGCLLLSACTGSQILVGKERPPISPNQVRIYLDPPEKFEKVAVLESNSTASWALTDQQKSNKAVKRLKERAAALGANGVLLQGVHNQSTGSVSSGQAWGNAGGIGFLGASTNVYMKVGTGIAIYVPPGAELAAQQAAFAQQQALQPASTLQPVPEPVPAAPYQSDPAKRCDACVRLRTP